MGRSFETMTPERRLDQMFSVGGDGTGATDMTVATATTFKVTCPAKQELYIERVLFVMVDGTMRMTLFGGIAALTTGVLITANDSANAVIHTFTPHLIKKLNDFGLIAGVDGTVTADAGDDTWIGRWTLAKAGAPLLLTAGQSMRILMRDDVSAVTEFHAMAQGRVWGIGT